MIHKFIFDGTRMVLDVHSGSLHVVDGLVWDLLDRYCPAPEKDMEAGFPGMRPEGEVREAMEEIKQLVEKRMLFSPDPLGGSYDPPGDSVVKALCVHLAHDCNLRCRYCFAGQGRFGGPPGIMTPEVGKGALEFLIQASGPRRRVEVDFFGGEPLLNFGVLRQVVGFGRELAREKGKEIKFTLTTNAVLLDREVGDFLNDNGVSVVLSLDGRKAVHDAMRPFPGGLGSYDLALKNIRSFLSSREDRDYYIRGTYTAANQDFCRDVEHLAALGFANISLEPVVAGPEDHYSLREEMLGELSSQYEDLARLILKMRLEGREINFFHFNIDIDGGPCLPKRMSGCGAGHQYLAVDPAGRLYPCHQFVGRDEFLMGDIFEGLRRYDLARLFQGAHLYRKDGCGRCWAKFLCSGGCHANSYFYGGSIEKPHGPACVLTKKRLECALYIYACKKLQL